METVKPQVKLNDIFYTSRGYDQTNIEYWQVIKMSKTGKTCTVRRIGATRIEEKCGSGQDFIMPELNNFFDDNEYKAKIIDGRRNEEKMLRSSLNFGRVQSIYKYENKGNYKTDAYSGH